MADMILTAAFSHSEGSIFHSLFGDVYSRASWRALFTASAIITALNYLMLLTFKDVPSGAEKDKNPDSSAIAANVPWQYESNRGVMVPQHIMLNLNALWIIVFMVPISWMVRKMRVLECMVLGMALATAGTIVSGFTATGGIFLLGIVFFSTGEMMTGPKKNEYLGLIAPPGKKGLYLGYVNIPVGIGGGFGAVMAGWLYGHYGEKATLALKYLCDHTDYLGGKVWDGKLATLESITGIQRTEAMAKLVEYTGMDHVTATRMLWDLYNPQYHVWIPFATIGVITIIALVIFAKMARKWSDMDA